MGQNHTKTQVSHTKCTSLHTLARRRLLHMDLYQNSTHSLLLSTPAKITNNI
jgi:hypothetical protein